MSFASDSFTGADSTELSAYSASWVRHTAASSSGVNAQLAGNRVRISTAAGNAYYYHATAPSSADYSVSVTVLKRSSDTGSCGAVGRLDPTAATGYLAQHDEFNGAWRLFKFVGGSYTQLGSSYAQTLTIDQAYTCKLELIGTSIKVYVDGVERISATDSEITAAGRAGINVYANGSTIGDAANHHLDDFDAATFAENVLPSGIISGEVFGTAVVSANGSVTIVPSGIASGEAFGTVLIGPHYTVTMSGIASSEAFGTAVVSGSTVAGISLSDPLKNNTGTVWASQSGISVAVLRASDLVSVFETSGLTTNASGILENIADVTIVAGTSYHVAIKLADGSIGISGAVVAA